MILAGDVRPGIKLLYNGEPYTVIDVTFVKPGKGGAFARTKVKNLLTGLQREVTWRTEEKLEQPDLTYKKVQYLYVGDEVYIFMDQDSFESVELTKMQVDQILFYLKEQEFYNLLYWDERLIDIQPPLHMFLLVTETTPGVRGDTAQGAGTKAATCETGLTLQVPLFIQMNDLIKVDTRTQEYIERMKK
jgi:elongation factor P